MNFYFRKILEQRSTLLILVLVFALWSATSLQRLQVDAVPDITNVQVMVNTKTGALSSEQIEKIITYPIESELAGLPHIKELRSLSKYGLSQVIAVFEDGTNIYFARQLVNERLQNLKASLPTNVQPELAPITTGLGEIFMWTLNLKPSSPLKEANEKEQLQYLRRIQEYTIRPQMKHVAGVADIDTNGGFTSEVHINYTPALLKRYALDSQTLINAVASLGVASSGAYIKKEGQQITITANSEATSIENIKNFVIKIFPDGRPLHLKDVARVEIEGGLRVGAATAMGEETVLGTVLMRAGENSRQVAKDAYAAFTKITLPDDVQATIVYSREYLVNATIHTVLKNLGEGAALVIVILILILGNWRAAIIVSLAIPLSMLFALKGMGLLHISANLMSLGAIDFGLLVDASVVFVENYLRRVEQSPRPASLKERLQLVMESCSEVAPPVIFGLIIIMLVYIPILSLEGVEGKMFEPMALTVLMALGASLLIALMIMPILIFWFIKTDGEHHHEPFIFSKLQQAYRVSLEWSLKHGNIVLTVIALIFVGALTIFSSLGSDFIPPLDEGDMIIALVRNSKQNIEESVKQQKIAERIILQFPEVERVFSRLGTPESATDPMSPNFADTLVILRKDLAQWPLVDGRRRTKTQLFEAIKKRLEDEMEEQDISSTQPIEMRVNEILEGSRADVTLRIFGPDLDKLFTYVSQAKDLLQGLRGVEALEFDALTGLTKTPVIEFTIDSKKAADYGLSTKNISEQMEFSLAGHTVGHYFLGEKRIPVIFHLDESVRDNLEVLKALPIPLPNGGNLPLSTFANLKQEEKVTTIARMWSQRYSAVSIYLGDRDISSFVNEAQEKISKDLKLDSGYSVEWGGQFKNLESARRTLMILVPIILSFIFFLILKVTRSWSQAFIIFSAVPLGLAGGVYSLYVRGMHFSVSAAVGFIALSGIVILNSMVLVSFINDLKTHGLSWAEAIRQGAYTRLRPIVMTALVASLGFLPMAFGSGVGSEVQRPLATVVIGGLMTSTLLTLIVVPLLLEKARGYFLRSDESTRNH